jgi:hypothetical protein
MSSTTIDLWPSDIKKAQSILTPASILRQQALLISKNTSNIIEGEVKMLPPIEAKSAESPARALARISGIYIQKDVIGNPNFQHQLFLIAPALSNYRHKLLVVEHLPTKIYPVTIYFNEKTIECADESFFIEGLKSVFADATTRQIIESLISQSTS